MIRIAVVGTGGGWSSEKLADALGVRTGFRLLVEMEHVRLDLPSGRAWYRGTDLSTLDGLVIKKIGARYSPDLLEPAGAAAPLAERGLPVYSHPQRILRSWTAYLQPYAPDRCIPIAAPTITEDLDQAWPRF
jgi:ribosomal protein S6--L-glutamate ligase